ncbi:MAG: PHP domain-containing protein [Chthoniobacterales bacterium]
MKKILIFTAGYGEGHNTAARNIRDALEFIAADEVQVEVLDLFETCYGKLNEFVKKAYLTAINKAPKVWGKIYELIDNTRMVQSNMVALGRMKKALAELLQSTEPDVILCTYPIYNYLIDDIYSDGRPRHFSQVTVITDSLTINSVWYRCHSDYLLVANDDSARVLRQAGIEDEKIRVFGFPVTHQFASLTSQRGPMENVLKVLFMINSGKKEAPEVARKLAARKDVQLTVTVGRDLTLRKEIEDAVSGAANPVELHGWTTKIPELLLSHHVLISKAGGATVQESIASCTPMIITQVVPGQEEGNARLIVENHCGTLATNADAIVSAIDIALEDRGALYQQWQTNITRLSRPEASLDIARFVLELGVPDNTPPRKIASFDRHVPPASSSRNLLMCDLHTHSHFSDGKLSIRDLVDLYGQHAFDALCITDHICDHQRLLGKLTNLTGMVLTPDQVSEYFETIEREKKRAWEKYRMILMAGLEFNKDGLTKKTSAHLLAIDLQQPIDPSLSIIDTIAEIHRQGALAVASHPHEFKSAWGKDTLYFWENIDTYAPLLDAWEVANRDDIFNPVGLKRLPFIANSDFHKPKHLFSWKTALFCEKSPEAIKECIRINRDVFITLYRDAKIGFSHSQLEEIETTPLIPLQMAG